MDNDRDGERIAKRLARAGVASRRDAERMIAEGRVRLNGRVLDTPAVVVTDADRIEVDGRPLAAAEPPRLWRYHKPAGLVTTARDEKGRDTVFDHLPPDMPRVMSVGRLDLTSEGLLLLTNDGEIKRRLELPSTGWVRKYRVRAHGAPSDAAMDLLRAGVTIDGERFKPMSVTLDKVQGANSWLTIGLREGKNREIRRAMEHIGLTVNRLIRVSYGPFQLGDLPEGAVEEVKGKVLADQLGLARETVRRAPAAAAKPAAAKPAAAKPAAARPDAARPDAGRAARRPGPPRPAKPGPDKPRPDGPPRPTGGKPDAPRRRRP
jgi:23S rRNA pseudouridine2605 synthase